MKYFIPVTLAAFLLLSPVGGFLSSAHAESGAVQKAIENVKESIGDLVGAKDEKTSDELGLRISTFRKVLELSIAETKNFKVSLIAIETKDEDILRWKNAMLETLKTAAEYFEKELNWLSDNEKTLTSDGIKAVAEQFKKWRENNYLSEVDQIQEFLLLEQEMSAIKTAERRLLKVTGEVKKILKTKGTTKQGNELTRLLGIAVKTITESRNLNEEGQKLFFADHVFFLIPISTSTSTSTPPVSTSTPPMEEPLVQEITTTSTPTSTSALPTKSIYPPKPSVKELVIASLGKIRDAYQTFIDMSGFVRDLLK